MCLLRFAQMRRLFLLLSSQTWKETEASSGIHFQAKIERGCKSCHFCQSDNSWFLFSPAAWLTDIHITVRQRHFNYFCLWFWHVTMKPPLLADFRLDQNTRNDRCRPAEMFHWFTRSAGDIFEMVNWWIFFSKHFFSLSAAFLCFIYHFEMNIFVQTRHLRCCCCCVLCKLCKLYSTVTYPWDICGCSWRCFFISRYKVSLFIIKIVF